jgi:hypothetical protein
MLSKTLLRIALVFGVGPEYFFAGAGGSFQQSYNPRGLVRLQSPPIAFT